MQNEQHGPPRSSMTSRERVLKAIRHEEPDRLPIDLGGMASTGIMAIAYARLKEHLGITNGGIRIFDIGQQLAEVEPEILSRFGVDVISLGNSLGEAPPEFWKPWKLPNGAPCQIPRTAHRGDFSPKRFGDLHGKSSHTTRGAINQNLLTVLNVPFVAQTLQGGHRRQRYSRSLFEC